MDKTLEQCLNKVSDPRRLQGQRLNLIQLFSIIIISNLCGHLGGRAIARFAKAHQESFTNALKLNHGVPSHVPVSDFINRVDETELISAFQAWTKDFVPLKKGDKISGDGKALGSTVSNQPNSNQNFQAIVSLFCQDSGLVYSIKKYENKKESEIPIVQFLISQLEGMGLNLFLDALHCQKKR